MEPESDAQQIASFLTQLGTNQDLLSKWVSKNPETALPQNLSTEAKRILLEGDIKKMREELRSLDADQAAPSRWIVIWVV